MRTHTDMNPDPRTHPQFYDPPSGPEHSITSGPMELLKLNPDGSEEHVTERLGVLPATAPEESSGGPSDIAVFIDLALGTPVFAVKQMDARWIAELHFAPTRGGFSLNNILVRRADAEGRAIQAPLRDLRQRDIILEVEARVRRYAISHHKMDETLGVRQVGDIGDDLLRTAAGLDEIARPGRPGRPPRSDLYYAKVAEGYVERLASKSPIVDISTDMGMSPSHVRDAIREARSRDILTATPRGKAGGELTPKAVRILGSRP